MWIPYVYASDKIGSDCWTYEPEINFKCLMKQTNFHIKSTTGSCKKSWMGFKLLQMVIALLEKSKSLHVLLKFCKNHKISKSHRSKMGWSKGVKVANM